MSDGTDRRHTDPAGLCTGALLHFAFVFVFSSFTHRHTNTLSWGTMELSGILSPPVSSLCVHVYRRKSPGGDESPPPKWQPEIWEG